MENISPAIQNNEISIYKGSLTTKNVVNCVSKIKKSFPNLPQEFYDVFSERIKANNFCDDRLTDAVNYVIDNCIYPVPTIANFISFDKRIKVFTYEQMVKKANECGAEIWDSYKAMQLPNMPKKVWIHLNDISQYNIESL